MRIRAALAALLAATLVVAVLGSSAASVRAQTGGPRFFPDTGYTVADDAFWDYFQKRGGVDTFGQPVSRKFLFLGTEVQFFQRLVMQKRADGSVTTLNLLDQGLMPVTRINGSSFPAPDPELIKAAQHAGISSWIKKPYRFDVFLHEIQRVMKGSPTGTPLTCY